MSSSSFHPDQNLPGCMMPDGGECCAGHAAVVDDWHKKCREIEKLTYQLVQAHSAIRSAVEAIERNSTSAPVLECLKASLPYTDDSSHG